MYFLRLTVCLSGCCLPCFNSFFDCSYQRRKKSMSCKSIKESINQRINQSIKELINQSKNQSINQRINLLMGNHFFVRNMIYGLPLKGEVKPRVMEYVLAAMMNPTTVTRDALTVKVVHHPIRSNGRRRRFNHEFIFRFDSDHDSFKSDVDLRISFVRTLARYEGRCTVDSNGPGGGLRPLNS